MAQTPAPSDPSRAARFKNLLIILLALIAAAEFGLLVRAQPWGETVPGVVGAAMGAPAVSAPADPPGQSDPAPTSAEQPPVHIVSVAFDGPGCRSVVAAFDAAIGAGAPSGPVTGRAPAELAPALDGTWTWLSPYVLRFTPSESWQPQTVYTLSFTAAALPLDGRELAGETSFQITPDPLEVELADLGQQPVDAAARQVRLTGSLNFSAPVAPEELLDHLSLSRPDGTTVPLEMTTPYPSTRMAFRSAPVDRTREPLELTLRLTPGLGPVEGSARVSQEQTWGETVVLDPILRVQSVDPEAQGPNEGRITVSFSAPVALAELSSHLSVSPTVAVQVAADGLSASLRGAFRPGHAYTLRLAQGLAGLDGSALEQGYSQEVRFPDLAPALDFAQPGMFLPPSTRRLAVEATNVDQARLTVDEVLLSNLFFFLEYNSWSLLAERDYPGELAHVFGSRLVDVEVPLNAPRNQPRELALELSDYLDLSRPGLYRIMLTPKGTYEGAQRWLMVTPLGLVAKRAPGIPESGMGGQGGPGGEVLVWTTRFEDTSPVAGARLTLYSDQNQVLAQGVSDGQGLWRVNLPDMASGADSSQAAPRPDLITVEKDGAFSFIDFTRFAVDTSGLELGGARAAPGGLRAYLFGERDIYRPGETMLGAAILRDAAMAAPPSQPLTLTLSDPQGRELKKEVVRPDGAGWLEFSWEIPAEALTGGYSLRLAAGEDEVGSYRFQVEEFVPDRISVEIEPGLAAGQTRATAGEALPFSVRGRYLFGPPASDLAVQARVRLEPADLRMPGHGNYVFGVAGEEFAGRQVMEQDLRLDAEGLARLDPTLPADLTPPAGLAAVLSASVREAGGRSVTATRSLPVDAYPYYLGLEQLGSQGVAEGTAVTPHWLAAGPDGKVVAAAQVRKLTASLIRQRYQTVLRRTPEGGVRYESVADPQVLESRSVDLPATGPAQGQLSFTPPGPGSYRILLTDQTTGARTALDFFVSGAGYVPWALEHPGRVELAADKESYQPGETAHIQVRAPFSGTALVALEREGVRQVRIVPVTGNTAEVDLRLDESVAGIGPDVFVTAVLVRPAQTLGQGEVAQAYGALRLELAVDQRKLPLSVTAVNAKGGQTRPEGQLEVVVHAAPGAQVAVAAVDEGILQLIDQSFPDPFAYFYAPRALQVDSFGIYGLLLPPVPSATPLIGGGMAMKAMAQYVSTQSIMRVRPVAFFSGVRTADANGEVRVNLDLDRFPDFQGALRIMAVAADGSRFGSAQETVTVKSPLVLLASLPRFAALGDRFDASATLRNDTGSAGTFGLDAQATGGLAADWPSQALDLDAGGQTTVSVPVNVGQEPGPASLTLTASGNNETSAATTELPVRSALPELATVRAGTLDKGETTLAAPEQIVPASLTRSLTVGASPMVPFTGSLEYLLGYPYGCLEQIVSQAFPLVRFAELAAALEPDLDATKARSMVQQAISRVLGLQTGPGGFAMWPGSGSPQPWMSVYATHFLVEAQGAGYWVDQASLDRALDYLGSLARLPQQARPDDLQRAAYALYVQGVAGAADRPNMEGLRGQLAALSPLGKALLAGAYGASGDPDSAAALLPDPLEPAVSGRATGGNLDSWLRNAALMLWTAREVPGTATKTKALASELARRLSGNAERCTTQENGLGFAALAAYLAAETAPGPFSGVVYAGKQELGRFDQDTRLSLAEIAGNDALRLVLESGSGAHYSLTSRAAPTPGAYKPVSQGLGVTLELLDREGQPLAPVEGADDGAVQVAQGDLVVLRITLSSNAGPVDNLAVRQLLPAGLEPENPRLAVAEKLPWMESLPRLAYQDVRDDRLVFFLDLPQLAAGETRTLYGLVRAVTPGSFALPPAAVEAMYDPALQASSALGRLEVTESR